MTCWMGMRALRMAAMACTALAAGLVVVPADSQALGSGRKLKPKPAQQLQFRIADNESPRPVDRLIFNYNYFSAAVEGGGTFGSAGGQLSGTFGPTPPGGSARTDGSFIGGDFQIPLSILFSSQSMARRPITPVVGVAVGDFFGTGEPIRYMIHPTPNPTLLTFQRQSSATFYGGVRVAVGDLFGNGSTVVITPRAGVNVENGRLTLVTDEAGPITRLSRSRTATGFHGGVDIDLFFPNPPQFTGGLNIRPFVGVGVFVNTAPDVSLVGRSALFDYRASANTSVNVGLKGRLGVAFNP